MSKKNRKQVEVIRADAAPESAAPTAAKVRGGIDQEATDDSPLDDLLPLGIGLLAMIMARAVEPGIRDLFQLPKQLYLATGATLLVGLAGVLAAMGRPLRFRITPMVWAGVALIASILFSLALAPSHTGGVLSIFARYDVHRWLAAAAVFWVTVVGVRRPRHLAYLIGGLLIGGLIVALIGIGEQHNIAGLLPEKRWTIISKPGSTFGNRNMAAEVVVAVVPFAYVGLAIGLRAFAHGKRVTGLLLMVSMSITLDLLLYYLMLTVTRSAWAGAIAGLVVAAALWLTGVLWAKRDAKPAAGDDAADPPARAPVGLFGRSAKAVMVPIALVVALNGGIAAIADARKPAAERVEEGDQKRTKSVPQLLKSFFDFESSAYRWRGSMLAASWNAMKHEPLGGGAGNWRVLFPKYLLQREKNEMFTIAKQPIRAHNDFLMFGSEYGFQGLLALLALLGLATWTTLRVVRKAANHQADPSGAATLAFASVGALMGIVGICGDAMASFPLQLPMPTFLFCVQLGIIAAADGLLSPREPDAQRRWSSAQSSGLIGAALLTMVYLQGFGGYVGLHERWMIAEHGFTDARNLQKQRGRAGEGLVEIRKAIAINPDDFQNHFIEALCLNSLGRTKEAIDSLHRSLALYPNLLNAWVNVAMFSARIGDTKNMDEAVDRALELKPDELIALNVRLGHLMAHDGEAKVLELVAKQVPGYQAYRTSGNWPSDDGGQLVLAYKTSLNHGITAAKKLQKWKEHTEWLQILDALGIPNDGRSEEAKRKERRERAAEISDGLRKLGQFDKALPWAQSAAELAGEGHAELKRAYAVVLAANGKFDEAIHEGYVAVRLDRKEKAELLKEIEDLKTVSKADPAGLAKVLSAAQSWFAEPAPPAAEPAPAPAAEPAPAAHE
ncbi:MAG: O-antigen ligase family protein [Deltaproteobacteria bacterium]|nr:O-antigen ligase family protein [Deltaproteobacteria bacterium]